jgi:hypothetical protein
MNTDEQNYRRFIIDDCDSSDGGSDGDRDGDMDGGTLDSKWITEYETKIMTDEYRLFLKSDITHVGFEFFYLDCDKKCVERIIPNTMYYLKLANQITQNEIFSVIQSHQKVDKKYYNFQSLLLYQFDFQYNTNDIVRGLSEYIRYAGGAGGVRDGSGVGAGNQFIEYTNLLSIDVIYFPPVITMFHDFIGFSVLLYED